MTNSELLARLQAAWPDLALAASVDAIDGNVLTGTATVAGKLITHRILVRTGEDATRAVLDRFLMHFDLDWAMSAVRWIEVSQAFVAAQSLDTPAGLAAFVAAVVDDAASWTPQLGNQSGRVVVMLARNGNALDPGAVPLGQLPKWPLCFGIGQGCTNRARKFRCYCATHEGVGT